MVGLYVPASQAKHVVELAAPWLLLALPAGQALQKVLPVKLQKPAAQGAHADKDAPPMRGL